MAQFKQKISGIVCLLGFLYSVSARAQTDTPPDEDDCTRDRECARHYLQARTLSKAGQLADALDEYHAAYTIQHVPTLLFNIARLNHKLGRLKEAASVYEAYLRLGTGTEPSLKEKAKEYLGQIPPQNEPPSSPPNPPPEPPTAPPDLQSQLSSFKPPPAAPSADPLPIYKRWWLWTVVGAVVLGGTIAVAVGTQFDFRYKPSVIIDLRGQL